MRAKSYWIPQFSPLEACLLSAWWSWWAQRGARTRENSTELTYGFQRVILQNFQGARNRFWEIQFSLHKFSKGPFYQTFRVTRVLKFGKSWEDELDNFSRGHNMRQSKKFRGALTVFFFLKRFLSLSETTSFLCPPHLPSVQRILSEFSQFFKHLKWEVR